MGFLKKLTSLIRPQPTHVELTPSGDAYIAGLSLAMARRRFRAALGAWDRGEMPTPDVHREMEVLYRSIFRRCLIERDLKSQEAYDFFNLAAEMMTATSYEPATRWAAKVGLELEAKGLGRIYAQPGWGQLVRKRGPIEHFVMIRCPSCGLEYPEIGTSGFLMIDFLWCRKCGNVYEAPLANEETERRLKPYRECMALQQDQTAQALGVTVHQCTCGGVLHTTHKCPDCGDGDKSERRPMSSFEYFESHRCGEVGRLPVRALGKPA